MNSNALSNGSVISRAKNESELWPTREVERLIGLKKETLLQMAIAGQFPRPIVLRRDVTGKPRKYAWRAVDVKAWIDTESSARGTEAQPT